MLNPSRYRILAIGKIRKKWIQEGIDLYHKRMPGLTIIELKDGNLIRETESVYATLKKSENLVALAEEGEICSSTDLSNRLKKLGSQPLAFVLGGANGLSPKIKASAKWSLSLSPLTFPHEIARLILLEQLYRAQTIQQGSPYHRD